MDRVRACHGTRLCAIVVLGLLVWGASTPPTAGAQQAEKIHLIGMLERTSRVSNAANLDGLRRGLRELGYVEKKNFVIEYRSADGRDERFPALANELLRLKVEVIVARGTPATLAAKNATGTVPVVAIGVGDPLAQGIVASLARPGANVTGLSTMVTEIYPKRVELLKALLPKAVHIAGIFNMTDPSIPPQWREVETAARSLGMQAQLIDVLKPEDLGPAFATAVRHHADGLVVGLDTLTLANQRQIVELAAKHRLPAVYASSEFVGGLAAYGVNYSEAYRRAASFVDKIFRNAKPADLPMEQPTKLELVLNLKAAKALGLTIPPAVLLQADQVVQ